MPDLAEWALRTPDRIAIVSPAGNRTFAELNANANRLVRALRHGVWCPATPSRCLSATGPSSSRPGWRASAAGYRLTPVNWHLTADEAGYIVDDCEAKALVADAASPRCPRRRPTRAAGAGC